MPQEELPVQKRKVVFFFRTLTAAHTLRPQEVERVLSIKAVPTVASCGLHQHEQNDQQGLPTLELPNLRHALATHP